MSAKATVKKILGEIPLTAETYWYLRQPGKPLNTSFKLHVLADGLPGWTSYASEFARNSPIGKQVLIFAVLHYWISHAAMMGLVLAGLGHRVTIAYLPYSRWQEPIERFDVRRQNLYARSVLRKASPLLKPVTFLNAGKTSNHLPDNLEKAVREISLRDTQYTLQVEEVDVQSELFKLRYERNWHATFSAMTWMQENLPDVVIIPNGSILEFGAVYRTVDYLGIPTVTYEFGEQRQRIWIAQNAEVMRQNTDKIWSARSKRDLNEDQIDQVKALFVARQKGNLWENFARRWQEVPASGGNVVRQTLGLDSRPIILLATNVIGDSLTLGRQVFSDSMTDWLRRTVKYFSERSDVQLLVRIHPGELLTNGPSVSDVVREALPHIPEHVHVIEASAQINTYDLVEIAALGLVYTTTVGMEMAMSGIPVIVVGNTHYRNKGFTLDPHSWDNYFELLDQFIAAPEKFQLTREQVESAWKYAYIFFYVYPLPYPWHLTRMSEDLDEWPFERVLSQEGHLQFGDTFRFLVGEPLEWSI
jgi:hypothetical protein